MPDSGLFEEPMSPGHVAADRGNEEAHQRDVDQGAGHRRQHMPTEAGCRREVGDQRADWHHAGQRDQGDVADRDVLLAARQQCGVPGGARPRGRHGGAQAGDHRSDEFRQRPHRRHPDGAGADETHLVAPGVLGQLRHRLRARRERREVRYAPGPADQRTDEHRDADPQAHQVADGEQARRTGRNRSRSRRRVHRRGGNTAPRRSAKMRVATMQAKTAATIAPQTTAASPARLSSTAAASACSPPPTLSTSAQATPSG